jgi:hypothetical protein
MRSLIALASTLALEGVLFATCFIAFSSMASAAVINIAAATFVPHDISEFVHTIDGRVTAGGVFEGAFGKFYAPVIFPSGGEVCSFSLVYRDNTNLGYVSAKLLKKKFGIGQTRFPEPVQMAYLQTKGAEAATRRLFEPDILGSKIDVDAFYYVDLSISLGVQVVGVQVNYRPDKCPP